LKPEIGPEYGHVEKTMHLFEGFRMDIGIAKSWRDSCQSPERTHPKSLPIPIELHRDKEGLLFFGRLNITQEITLSGVMIAGLEMLDRKSYIVYCKSYIEFGVRFAESPLPGSQS